MAGGAGAGAVGGNAGQAGSGGSSGSAGSGGLPATCGETCSGKGTCVSVDAKPTCACDTGYYRVGLECLADPCEKSGTCYYVDSSTGADNNDGSRAKPWKTLARVNQAASSLNADDYVLFRRGEAWTGGATLSISGVKGADGLPVTYGAYGPLADALPKLRAIRIIKGSSHVTVRDMESTGSDGGPCVNTSESDHVTIQGVTAHDCQNNGIHFGKQSSYGVIIDSTAYDIPNNDALVVHSPTGLTLQNKVGDHFWIVDNRVPGPVKEQPVDVATGNDTVPGSRDIKIVGNVLGNGGNGCIVLGHGTSVTWIIGNIMGKCTQTETAFALHVGGSHKEHSGVNHRVSGNVVFWNLMPGVSTGGEAPSTQRAWIENNTLVNVIGKRPVIRASYGPGEFHIQRNVLWTTGSQAHVQVPSQSDVKAMDHNWYVPDSIPGCRIDGKSLVDWQSASGFDKNSSCAPIPGMSLPTQKEVDDFNAWTSQSFLDRFTPDSNWSGCADNIGAIDCATGKLRVEFKPIAGYADNNGYGWRGPLIVQQRYPLPTK